MARDLASAGWCARRDLNPQPSDPKSDALSIELRAHDVVLMPVVIEACQGEALEKKTHVRCFSAGVDFTDR